MFSPEVSCRETRVELVTGYLLLVSFRVVLFSVLNSDQGWSLMNTFEVLIVADTEFSISWASAVEF